MRPTAVLAIGLDPRFADLRMMPQFTPELIHAYIEAEIARIRELGFDAENCLIASGEEAEAEASTNCLLVAPAYLEKPDAHAEPRLRLLHGLLQYEGRGTCRP